jgi:hypothetical protein
MTKIHMRSRRAFVLLGACAVLALLISFLFMPILRHAHRESPDGEFDVVVRTQPIYALIPVMPGGGSDMPARATLYRGHDSCGSVWLPMASFVDELQWRLDGTPREAEIKLVGRWNLDECSAEQE